MCGIAGIIGGEYSREQRRVYTRAMLDSLIHRGPDGDGLCAYDTWSLGHKRLAIIAPMEGAQPMWSADGRFCISYNGEIYNYIEIRQLLESHGVVFQTRTDTEVLLHLLVQEGVSGLKRCNGMFAFALYDTQKKVTILARDHCGIKPLYYASVPHGGYIFASEVKSLLRCPHCPAQADLTSLDDYLVFQFCFGDRTLFKGISKVPAGHAVCISEHGDVKTIRWYEQNHTLDGYHNEAYFVDMLLQQLEESIRLQLRSDVPLGAYLSGGLDSSVIATLAARYQQNLHCFSGYFTESVAYDETAYARAVCDGSGLHLHTLAPCEQDFVDWMPQIIRALDEPVAGPGVFPQFMISQLASKHVTVCLGGQGGDEVFGGYARYLVAYLEQALKGAIFETHTEGKFVVTLESMIPNLSVLHQYVPMLKQFWKDGLFDEPAQRYFTLLNRSAAVLPLLSDERKSHFDMESLMERFFSVFEGSGSTSSINKMLYFDQQTMLPALLQVEDRASMYSSLESRVPFLDPQLMQLAASIPPTIKFKDGRLKNILRQAVANLVAPEVYNRKDKMGFPVPLKEWMQRTPVRDFVADILLSKSSIERNIYSRNALELMISGDGSAGQRGLWGALCLELWHQTFIDNGGSYGIH